MALHGATSCLPPTRTRNGIRFQLQKTLVLLEAFSISGEQYRIQYQKSSNTLQHLICDLIRQSRPSALTLTARMSLLRRVILTFFLCPTQFLLFRSKLKRVVLMRYTRTRCSELDGALKRSKTTTTPSSMVLHKRCVCSKAWGACLKFWRVTLERTN